MRTLLVAHPKWTWREWLKENLGDRDLVVLDPAWSEKGPPARCSVHRGGKTVAWQLVGTLDVQKNPVGWLGAAHRMVSVAADDAVVLLFSMKVSPVLRQLSLTLAQSFAFSQILVPETSRFETQPWPVGAETVELAPSFLPVVQDAQRRARWLELVERCEQHVVPLGQVAFVGARLGSGTRLRHKDLAELAEISGGVLHVVTDRKLPEPEIRRAMDVTHATRLSMVSPGSYQGLLCSFCHQNGEDFGMGFVKSLDPVAETLTVMCDAVVPAPVRIVRLGLIKIDAGGIDDLSADLWTV